MALPNGTRQKTVGSQILTYPTGKSFDFNAISQDDICIEDIAHSLSMQCRYNGHCRKFYSVAQHSVEVSMILPNKLKMCGLLHDAAEAYTGDMVAPCKYISRLDGFRRLEKIIQEEIADKFNLPWPTPPEVKKADDVVLATEYFYLKDALAKLKEPPVYRGYHFHCWDFESAEKNFLQKFHEYERL